MSDTLMTMEVKMYWPSCQMRVTPKWTWFHFGRFDDSFNCRFMGRSFFQALSFHQIRTTKEMTIGQESFLRVIGPVSEVGNHRR